MTDTVDKIVEKSIREAELSMLKKDYSFAINQLSNALDQDPTNLEAHYLMGIAHSRKKLFPEAIYHLKEVLSSQYVFLYTNHVRSILAYIYIQQQQYGEARSILEKAINVEPKNTFIISMLAFVYYKDNQIDYAIKLYNRVIDLEPSNYNAKNCIGYIQIEKQLDVETGIQFCEDALKLSPNNPSILDSLGWGFYIKGENDKAVEYLRKAFDLAPESQEIKDHLREILAI